MPITEQENFAEIQLPWIYQQGFRRVVLAVGYRADQIERFCSDGSPWALKLSYSHDGPTPIGTGGAVRQAWESLRDENPEFVAVLYGDTLLDFDLPAAVQMGMRNQAKAVMTFMRDFPAGQAANGELLAGGKAVYSKLQPDPKWKAIDYGFMLLHRDFFKTLPLGEVLDLAKPLEAISKAGELWGFEAKKPFREINTPENIQKLADHIQGMHQGKKGLVLLDRDGVINEMVVNPEHGFIDSPLAPDQLRMLPGVTESLLSLQQAGWGLAIVTNQPSAKKGKTTYANLEATHARVVDELARGGIQILSSHICFDRSEDKSPRRKPAPGMLYEALTQNAQYPRWNAWMVGDGVTDVEAGARAGVKTAFLGPKKCDACKIFEQKSLKPDFWGSNLSQFVQYLLSI